MTYVRRERPTPTLIHDGLVVPGDSAAEVAGALDLLDALLRGALSPRSARQQQLTRAQQAVRSAAREAAARHQQARRSWAAPTVAAAAVLGPAQLAGSSEHLVSTGAAAAATGFSGEWVRRLAVSGIVRGRQGPRRTWEVDLDDVLAYKARTTERTGPDGRDPGGQAGRSAA